MKPSDFKKMTQCQFDCLVKRVVKCTVKNYYKELVRRSKKEVPFSEIPPIVINKIGIYDEYESDYSTLNVCGMEVNVFNEQLFNALKRLPEKKRSILLMYYFLEMSDKEISSYMNIGRTTSYRNRTNSLEKLREIFKEGQK